MKTPHSLPTHSATQSIVAIGNHGRHLVMFLGISIVFSVDLSFCSFQRPTPLAHGMPEAQCIVLFLGKGGETCRSKSVSCDLAAMAALPPLESPARSFQVVTCKPRHFVPSRRFASLLSGSRRLLAATGQSLSCLGRSARA